MAIRIPDMALFRKVAAGAAQDGRGGVAVEFAVVLPLMVVLIAGTVDLGRLMWITHTLSYTVQQAARCRAVDANNCGSASATQSWAQSHAGGVTITDATAFVVSSCSIANGNGPSSVPGQQVAITYIFNFPELALLPGGSDLGITITAQSCFPKVT